MIAKILIGHIKSMLSSYNSHRTHAVRHVTILNIIPHTLFVLIHCLFPYVALAGATTAYSWAGVATISSTPVPTHCQKRCQHPTLLGTTYRYIHKCMTYIVHVVICNVTLHLYPIQCYCTPLSACEYYCIVRMASNTSWCMETWDTRSNYVTLNYAICREAAGLFCAMVSPSWQLLSLSAEVWPPLSQSTKS